MASISPACTWNVKFSKSTNSELPIRNTFRRFCTLSNPACSLRCRFPPHVTLGEPKRRQLFVTAQSLACCANSLGLPELEHADASCVSDTSAALKGKNPINYDRTGRLFVTQCLRRQDSGRGERRVDGGNERNGNGDKADQRDVPKPRRERNIIDGVDLGGK